MELTRGQNLFEALQRVCDFSALEPEMDEILRAVEKDNGLGEYPKETPLPSSNHEVKIESIGTRITRVEVDGINFHRL